MENNTQNPSVFRILQSDYTAGLSLIMIIVVWGMYLILMYYGKIPGTYGRDPLTTSDAPGFLKIAMGGTLLGIPLLTWRINFFNSLFKNAEKVTGYITYIHFYRDRGKVEYEYTYGNNNYTSHNAIFKSGRTKYYQQGDEITLMVDPENPKKAVIRDLYVKKIL
jgi:hypothetical protein